MRCAIRTAALGLAMVIGLASSSSPCRAQGFGSSTYAAQSAYFAPPGYFGMAWGAQSYGIARTYSAFSSPYGLGYGAGYGPYSYPPGRYGVGLWRPGYSVPGYAYESSLYAGYRTFPTTIKPVAPPPPVGVYAPAFGPGFGYGW